MDAGFQRERIRPGIRRQLGIWEQLHMGLDTDQRIVLMKMYKDNPKVYDMIHGTIFIIGNRSDPTGPLDWCWESSYERIAKRRSDEGLYIVEKAVIARLRLPWNTVRYEWLVSEDELSQNPDDYSVIDTFIKVVNKDNPNNEAFRIKKGEFEANRDLYEVVEIRYLVGWAMNEKEKKRLIDPDKVHKVIAH